MTGTTGQPSYEPPVEKKENSNYNNNNNKAWGEEGEENERKNFMGWKKPDERKPNVPMNHMIDVASYWAYASQKTADLGH